MKIELNVEMKQLEKEMKKLVENHFKTLARQELRNLFTELITSRLDSIEDTVKNQLREVANMYVITRQIRYTIREAIDEQFKSEYLREKVLQKINDIFLENQGLK